MEFSQPIMDLIRVRRSVRTYDPRPLEAELRTEIEEALRQSQPTVFNNPVRLQLVDKDYAADSGIRLGTYGLIKNARSFVAGAVQTGEKCCVDFGYVMEKIILFLTGKGLGTCWLGGTLTRGRFAKAVDLQQNEELPAATPVGFPAARKSLRERLLRLGVRPSRRKPWKQLFFEEDFVTPLTEGSAGQYALPLEMVRLGPSATNAQPWRIVKEGGGERFHFCLNRTGMHSLYRATDLQHLDLGIAMCHFELTAREMELSGSWLSREPEMKGNRGWEYIVTWEGGG